MLPVLKIPRIVSHLVYCRLLNYRVTAGQTVITYLGWTLSLPYNEKGVYSHFIALGGIDDSDLGYLVGNGDDVNALGGHGIIPCRWYGWNQFVAAEINGMIAIQKVSTTTVATSNISTVWKAAGTTTAKRW